MKLCIIIPSLKAGGSERVSSELANFAVKRGYSVSFILLSNNNTIFFPLSDQIDIHYPDFRKKNLFIYYLRVIYFIRKQVFKLDPDALLVMGYKVLPALAVIGTSFKLTGSQRASPIRQWTPLQGTSLMHKLFRYTYNFVNKWALLRYDRMIVQSNMAFDILKQRYKKKCEFKVIPNFLRPIKEYETEKKRQIICVGRLSPEKGQKYLIDAFYKLNNSEWKLIFVGDGSIKKSLEEQVKLKQLTDRVEFLGFREDVDYLMQQSEVFVLPSLSEGFPNALLEAMANGIACVSFDCDTGPSLLIEHGKNGFLVEVGDVDKLSYYIGQLLNDDNLRSRIGNEARKVRKLYDIENIGQQYLDFIFA